MENNDIDKKAGGKPGGPRPRGSFNFYWIYAVIFAVIIALNLFSFGGSAVTIKQDEFKAYVQNGDVERQRQLAAGEQERSEREGENESTPRRAAAGVHLSQPGRHQAVGRQHERQA